MGTYQFEKSHTNHKQRRISTDYLSTAQESKRKEKKGSNSLDVHPQVTV